MRGGNGWHDLAGGDGRPQSIGLRQAASLRRGGCRWATWPWKLCSLSEEVEVEVEVEQRLMEEEGQAGSGWQSKAGTSSKEARRGQSRLDLDWAGWAGPSMFGPGFGVRRRSGCRRQWSFEGGVMGRLSPPAS